MRLFAAVFGIGLPLFVLAGYVIFHSTGIKVNPIESANYKTLERSSTEASSPKRDHEHGNFDDESFEKDFIEFLRIVQKTAKVNKNSLEVAMDIKMRPRPSGPGHDIYEGITKKGSRFVFIYGAGRVDLVFPEVPDNPIKTDCVLEFAEMHKELVSMGFSGERRNIVHMPRNGWEYLRDDIRVFLDYDRRRFLGIGEDLRARNVCVESIAIYEHEREQ